MRVLSKEQTNQKLCTLKTAAADLFSSIGYHAVSLRDLAKEINLSPGAIYNHIDSKQDLLFTLTDESFNQRIHLLTQEISHSVNNGLSALDAITQGFITHSSNGKLGIALAMRELSSFNPSQRSEIQRLINIENSIIAQSLATEFNIDLSAEPLLTEAARTLTELMDGYFFAQQLNVSKNPTFLFSAIRASATTLLTTLLKEKIASAITSH